MGMKKLLAAATLICIILTVVLSAASCSQSAPPLDEVKDRMIYLIEGSKEINALFFGKGIPVYDRESLLVAELGVYYDDKYTAYNRALESGRYLSVDHMKEEAEKIYSEEYLAAIYETAFDGFMTGNSSAYLRFLETNEWLFQNRDAVDFKLSERIYDYSTIEIVKPSSNKYINITIETYTIDNPKRETITLSFTFERGNWYLDTPTY
jgi:hypothetical protein